MTEGMTPTVVPTLPVTNLDTLHSESTSRPFQSTSRGRTIRMQGLGDDTVRIGPSKTPNFLANYNDQEQQELPSFHEDENPLSMIEEEKEN